MMTKKFAMTEEDNQQLIRILAREEFNKMFTQEEISSKINLMLVQFDKNLSQIVIDIEKRLSSLEQDLIDTIKALKQYMDK
jgi:hypothetical protein